jgi:hypothetical protein
VELSLERLARNQILFREVNERLREIAVPGTEPSEYVCECSDLACTTTIPLSPDEYEGVRSYPAVFVIATGHERLEVERIVESNGHFALVEKIVGVDAAVALDPRSPGADTA